MNSDDISIVLAGEAGQGIQTIEIFLSALFKRVGYNVFATKEYMSRVRGGSNSTEIRVSSKKVNAFVSRIDILISLARGVISRLFERISPQTIVIGDKVYLGNEVNGINGIFFDIPFSKIASDIGNIVYSNTIAIGVIAGILGIERSVVDELLMGRFSEKGDDVVKKNMEAVSLGYIEGDKLSNLKKIDFKVNRDEKKLKDTYKWHRSNSTWVNCRWL